MKTVVDVIYGYFRNIRRNVLGGSSEDFFSYEKFGDRISEPDISRIARILDEELSIIDFKERESNIGTAYRISFLSPEDWEQFVNLKNSLDQIKVPEISTEDFRGNDGKIEKTIDSITLYSHSLEPKDDIFIVINNQTQNPFRKKCHQNDRETSIRKLYRIAYSFSGSSSMEHNKIQYDKNVADGINNGLFKRGGQLAKYINLHELRKPTLVIKSSDKKYLVPSTHVKIKTALIKSIPDRDQSFYK